jgi:hypothetical protein
MSSQPERSEVPSEQQSRKVTTPFDNQNGLGNDKCAIKARNFQNSSIMDYQLWNTYDCHKDEEVDDFGAKSINLHFKNGYGFTSPCLVDTDTKLRIDAMWTSEKAKSQMFTRFYKANPDLSRGTLKPVVESRLVQGENSSRGKVCFRHAEIDFDRNLPLLPCLETDIQNPDHLIMPFSRGGEDSRQIMRSRQPTYDRRNGGFVKSSCPCN